MVQESIGAAVVVRSRLGRGIWCRAVQLFDSGRVLWRFGCIQQMVQHGPDQDGVPDRRLPVGVGHGADDLRQPPAQRTESWWARVQPRDVILLVALIGLLVYALTRGIDERFEKIAIGLIGLLLGKSLAWNGRNGKR